MYALEGSSRELITLRVASAERSRGFYLDLFGLVPVAGAGEGGPEGAGEILQGPEGAGAGSEGFVLRLLERAPAEPPSELWISVEVGSITEVLDLYLLAIMIGARATLPRKRGDRWNTTVTDPDGHHISIWTSVPGEARAEATPAVRRSPRWEWERSRRPGYDAGGAGRERPAAPEEGAGRGVPEEERGRVTPERSPADQDRDRATGVP